MTAFYAFINLFVMGWLAYQVWRRELIPSRMLFWPALLYKVTAGVCLGLIYLYYYNGVGDTILYFTDAKVLTALARNDPMTYLAYLWNSDVQLGLSSDVAVQPRAVYLLKLTSVFNLLTHDNYWITSVYFSFVSFMASWYLVRQIGRTVPSAYWPAVVGFLFFPTAVFWSAGLIKETLAMAGLFLLWGCYIRIWFSLPLRAWEWVLIPLAVWVVWSLKYYFLGAWIPVAAASLIVHKLRARGGVQEKSLMVKMLIWCVVMVVPLTIVSWLHPNFQPDLLLQVIVENYQAFHMVSNPEDLIYYEELKPDWLSMLFHAPKAAFAGLFRPMLWEVSSALQVIAAVENMIVLLLTATTLWNFRSLFHSPFRLLIATVLLYTIVLATFLALSTPNFGTLSRYRVGFLSLFVTVMLSCNPFFDRLLRSLQRYPDSLGR